jgi:class 3 adenylate cyclase
MNTFYNTCGFMTSIFFMICIQKYNKKIKLLKNLLPFDFDEVYLQNKMKYISNKNGCILFSDIVSYCEIAEKYSDFIIYMILNDMFSRFDTILQKYKYIQKIETIGDAYMVVGDMYNTEYNNKMFLEMVFFALEIMDEVKRVHTPSHTLEIRIGIHFGSYVISVLGKINPRLCIVGKHVNKTARLQSTAEVNTIQISKELYNKINGLDNTLILELNRDVHMKHIGIFDTYTVRRAEL